MAIMKKTFCFQCRLPYIPLDQSECVNKVSVHTGSRMLTYRNNIFEAESHVNTKMALFL